MQVPVSAVLSQLEQVVVGEMQLPLEQVWPLAQAYPQAPQSVTEVRRSWQPSLQLVKEPQTELVVVQLPPTHESPDGHA
jgi:hypothetical protein